MKSAIVAMKRDLLHVGARSVECLEDLGRFLTPPYDPVHREHFAGRIRKEIRCEAVSIFMSEEDPNRLDLAAGVGYKSNYAQVKYYATGFKDFLTSFVYRHRTPLNMSDKELRKKPSTGIPFSGRCRVFIESDKFFNLIAVPILAHPSRCLGVLKMENKLGAKEDQKFPDEDFAFAQVLAALIGVGYQRQLYGQLLAPGSFVAPPSHTRNVIPYLQYCVELLARQIRAECVSIFLRESTAEQKDVLRYSAGIGYREGYQRHVYE